MVHLKKSEEDYGETRRPSQQMVPIAQSLSSPPVVVRVVLGLVVVVRAAYRLQF